MVITDDLLVIPNHTGSIRRQWFYIGYVPFVLLPELVEVVVLLEALGHYRLNVMGSGHRELGVRLHFL